MNPEFKVGQTVTFKPYEKECVCVVDRIQYGSWCNGKTIHGEHDDRVFYQLKGEAVSLTTGQSIMESTLYNPSLFQFDVLIELFRKIPEERREANKENYHWILNNLELDYSESYDITEAYNCRLKRYRVSH